MRRRIPRRREAHELLTRARRVLQSSGELVCRHIARPHQDDVDAGRGRCAPVEELCRAEQALHHLAEARPVDVKLELVQ